MTKIRICGPEMNSYSKTDHDATFMRMKKDYMGNDQLLPAYNIQAEGVFGIMKYDRWHKRTVRKGLQSVKLELFLVSIGHNLFKFHNKQMRLQKAA